MTTPAHMSSRTPLEHEPYAAARVRLATLSDTPALARLYPQGEEDIRGILEQGGALLLEDAHGHVAYALRWREQEDGWQLIPASAHPTPDDLIFARWLMTKLEALAIKRNVPRLTLEVDQDDHTLALFERMGYRPLENATTGGSQRLGKQLGGTWQTKRDR